MNNDNKIYWLYSSKYTDSWWLYDYKINKQLNKIYNDYITRKYNMDSLSSKQIQIANRTKNEKEDKFYVDININNTGIRNAEFNNAEISNSDSEDIELSYIITISGSKYTVDIEKMMQINCDDVYKRRRIKRVSIRQLENIYTMKNNNDIQLLFKRHDVNVIGISGNSFINKRDTIKYN